MWSAPCPDEFVVLLVWLSVAPVEGETVQVTPAFPTGIAPVLSVTCTTSGAGTRTRIDALIVAAGNFHETRGYRSHGEQDARELVVRDRRGERDRGGRIRVVRRIESADQDGKRALAGNRSEDRIADRVAVGCRSARCRGRRPARVAQVAEGRFAGSLFNRRTDTFGTGVPFPSTWILIGTGAVEPATPLPIDFPISPSTAKREARTPVGRHPRWRR